MELKGHGGTKKRSPEEDKRKEIADYVWQLWIYERSPPPPAAHPGNIRGNIFQGAGYTTRL